MLYSTRSLVLMASRLLLMLLLLLQVPSIAAFSLAPTTTTTAATIHIGESASLSFSFSSSALYSSNTPPQRKARRNLQKRRRRNKNEVDQDATASTTATTSSSSSSATSSVTGYSGSGSNNNDDNYSSGIGGGEMVEIRPLISSTAKEVGEDYWIDEEELRRAKERQLEEQRMRLRRREPGQVTDEKLWGEVLSPYKDNWIGIFSVVIVVLATIVTQFPELLQTPLISIPDL
jgi:hypothetical protein